MTTLTLRQQKLSPLTNQEVDDNFSNLNINKLESVVYSNLTTSGSGWFRVATTTTDGRGTYDLEVYTTGGNHDPSVLKIFAQCNWTGGRVVYAVWDEVFPASSVRVTRSATNSFLEVYFTASVNTFGVRVNHSGFASGIVGYSGALNGGGDTVADTLALTSRFNVSSINTSLTSAQVTGALGYTPYNSTNPSGYTTNTGTVTSVSGTGTVSGLTLTGTVTGSGSLTLGGTLSLTSSQVTDALGYTPYNSSNPSGYITGYTETDTLATVTARGASTSTSVTLSSNGNHYSGHLYYDAYESGGNHYPHFLDGSSNSGVKVNWRLYTGSTNSVTHYWGTDTTQFATKLESTSRVDAPLFYDRNDTAYYCDPNSISNLWALKLNRNTDHQLQVARIRGLNTDRTGDYIHMYERVHIGYPSGWGVVDAPSYGLSVWGEITAAQSNYTAGWGYPRISTASGWGGGAYPTIGSTGGSTGSLIMLHNPHIPFRTENARSGASGRSGIRLAIDTAGSNWWDVGLTGDDFEIFRNSSSTQEFRVDNAGNSYSRVSSCAPLFYDSNDTSYYIDPNSTSITNILRANSILSPNGQSVVAADSAMPSAGGSFIHTLAYGPGGNDGHILAMTWSGTTSVYGAQLWLDTDPTNLMALRSRSSGGAWNSWSYVITDWSNDQVKSGYFQSNSSLRAPIFYDSNDTGYYCDPNGNSQFWGIRIRGDASSAATDNQITFWGGGSASTTSAIGFKSNSAPFQSPTGNGDGYNTYLTMDSDGRGWVFRRGVGGSDFSSAYTSGWILNNGIWQSQGSMRAPIFYDSNDTNFSLDPNGNSNLNRVTSQIDVLGAKRSYYIGNITASGTQARRFEIARVYIDYNDWHGAGIIQVELHNNYSTGGDYQLWNISYDYNVVSCNLIAGDSPRGRNADVKCSSPVQISGDYYYISIYVDVRYYGYYYGYIHTSWPETTTHQGQSGYILVYTTSSAAVTNISDFTPSTTINTTNIQQSSSSVRAPIFYDSDNTGYYVDPASTSNINALNLAGQLNAPYIGIANTANTNGYGISLYNGAVAGEPTYGLMFQGTGTFGTHGGVSNANDWATYFTMNNDNGRGWIFRKVGTANVASISAGGRGTFDESVRSPIFYDSNDTGYYLNPNGSSRLNDTETNQSYTYGWFRNYSNNTGLYNQNTTQHLSSNTNGYWDMSSTTSVSSIRFYTGGHVSSLRGYVYADSSNNIGFLNSSGSWRARVVGDDYWLVDGSSARAQLYYDSNDTGYYSDQASTSRYNYFVPNKIKCIGNVNNEPRWDFSAYVVEAQHWYGNNSSQTMYMGESGNTYQIPGSGGIRPTIMYDYNDTGYYCDPNSTSKLYRTESYYFRNIYDVSTDHPFGVYFGSNESTAYAIYRESGAWNHPYPDLRIAFHTGIKIGANASYQGVRFYTDYDMSSLVMSVNNADYASGSVYIHNDIRAPIFYDANNTTYYCDPSSNTNVAGSITAGGNITAYSDLKLKANIHTITNAIELVNKLRGVTFTRLDLADKEKQHIGVIAQEVEQYLPQVVENNGTSKSVAYGNITALLIEAVKEQQQQIDKLTKLVEVLLAK